MKFGEPSDVQTARTYRYYTQTAKSIQAEPTNRKKLQTGRTPRQQQRTDRTPRQQQRTGRTPRQQNAQAEHPDSNNSQAEHPDSNNSQAEFPDSNNLYAEHPDSNNLQQPTGRTLRQQQPTNMKFGEPSDVQTSRAYRHYTQTATSIQAEPTDGKKLQTGRKPRQQPADVHTATSPHLTGRTPRQQQPNRQNSPTAAAYKRKIRRTLRRTDSMNLQVLHPDSNRQTYIQQQAHTEVEPTNKKLEEPQRQE